MPTTANRLAEPGVDGIGQMSYAPKVVRAVGTSSAPGAFGYCAGAVSRDRDLNGHARAGARLRLDAALSAHGGEASGNVLQAVSKP
jgi:hypothetical protein